MTRRPPSFAGQEVLFSCNPDYLRAATVELRRALSVHEILPVGPDAGIVVLSRQMGGIREVAQAADKGKLRFVRHIAQVLAHAPTREVARDTPEQLGDTVVGVLHASGLPVAREVSVHVWEAGEPGLHPSAVRRAVVSGLEEDHDISPSGNPETVSVCLGEQRVVICANATELSLSDWPGGRVRLGQSPDMVSRAELKLEELLSTYAVRLRGTALDLGAAPGGWTRIVLGRGVQRVHAVDPAALHPRIAGDPRVVHHATTGGEFLRATGEQFDVVLNDMKMDQLRSVRLVLHAAQRMTERGLVVLTLKLRGGDPVADVDRALDLLKQQFEVLFVRQLHHNRHEVTVVARLLTPEAQRRASRTAARHVPSSRDDERVRPLQDRHRAVELPHRGADEGRRSVRRPSR